ncbi:MAG: helix-turn-helix domain-containing protein [Saprospiraceae bacterium]
MQQERTFGETIKKLREERNLTLKDVAKHLQIDTSMLGKIEKNNRKATKSLIEKLAAFYNVNSKELKIAFLSDQVIYEVIEEKEFAQEILKAAEAKVRYLNLKDKV